MKIGVTDRKPSEARARKTVLEMSPRQAEVYALHRVGLTQAEIARALGLSPSTAKMHLDAAYDVLEMRKVRGLPRSA